MENAKPIWTPDQRYAAAALFALALQQSQIRPVNPLGLLEEERCQGFAADKCNSLSDEPKLWVRQNSGILSHVFRYMSLDEQAAEGLKETAASCLQFQDHVGTFLEILSEEVTLNKTGDASGNHKHNTKCHEKSSDAEVRSLLSTVAAEPCEGTQATRSAGSHKDQNTGHEENFNTDIASLSVVAVELSKIPRMSTEETTHSEFGKPEKDESFYIYQRKVVVLYELLSACLSYNACDDNKSSQPVKAYDARHRVALRLLATWFHIHWSKVEAIEMIVATSLMDSDEKEEGTKSSEERWSTWKRGGIIGAAALTGGTLMAITGGIAAPGIAQGITALAPTMGSLVPSIGASGFTAAASATGSVAGSVAVAASFGAAGAGLTGYKMAKRVGDITEFEFHEIEETQNQGLAVGIFVSGVAFKDEDFVVPWEGQDNKLERYALRWESKELITLSTAVQDWLTSKLAMELMKDGAMMTVLSTLLSALAMPAMLVSAISLIDNQWAIAVDRSDKAGKLLADILLEKLHGNRPVTLVGFSLGARTIFKCLWFLAEAKGDNAGLVERVVLLGAPVSLKDEMWDIVRKMVAGRFVNAYSTNDWNLGVIFRATLLSEGLAGIQPVDLAGVENVDVTELVEGHSSYLHKTREILERLDLENYYPVYRTHDQVDAPNSETLENNGC